MERYNYEEAVKNDVRQYLEENWGKGKRIEVCDRTPIYDDMFISDSVTGNGSGSYTYNSFEAEECVCHNLNLLGEALDEFCTDSATLREKLSGEWADVTIRCYMLGQVFGDVVDEWNAKIDEEKGDEDEEKEDEDEDSSSVADILADIKECKKLSQDIDNRLARVKECVEQSRKEIVK